MELEHYLTALMLAILPALFWLTIYYKKDYRDPEPKKVIAKTFGMGMLAAIPFLALRFLIAINPGASTIINMSYSVVIFAALEEMAKLSAAIFVVSRNKVEFNQIIDGVVYAVVAALGFAFIENIIYFTSYLDSGYKGLIYIIAFRSFGSMLAHTIFSGIAGLIWAYAYFSKQITPFSKKHLLAFELKDFINKEVLSLHIIRRNILKAHPSRRGGHEKKILVLEGIFLATFFHIIFNLTTEFDLFGKNLTFLLVPSLIAGFLFLSYEFEKRFNQKIFKVV